MNISELQEELSKRNITMTAREISRLWNIDEASYSRKKRTGSEIKYDNIKILEDFLNINLTSECQTNVKHFAPGDRIEINYWSELPEELRNPKIQSVWFDREIIENAWGMNDDHLCIIPMVGDKMTRYWYPIRHGDILIVDLNQNYIMGNGVYFGTSQKNTRFWIREMQILINQSVEFKGFAPSGDTTKVFTQSQLENVDFRLIGKVIKNVSFRL